MIRLSFHIHLQYSILASWLQVLHEYFQDLLLQPICQVKPDENGCLEGSPFLFSILDGEVYSMSLRHLQRQAVFLFLRCSFSLISLREEIREQCAYATTNSCVTFDLNSNLECCSQKKGLSELYEWLQGHILKYLVVDHEMYWEKCIDFALSFLQLFMHEVCFLALLEAIFAMLYNFLRIFIFLLKIHFSLENCGIIIFIYLFLLLLQLLFNVVKNCIVFCALWKLCSSAHLPVYSFRMIFWLKLRNLTCGLILTVVGTYLVTNKWHFCDHND